MSTTAAGMPARRQMPRRRALAAVLAVSVALNICVVAGAVWSRFGAPPAPSTISDRFHRLADRLDLTPAQRPAFDAYVASMVARGNRLRQDVEPALDAAWNEVAKPNPDPALVTQLLDQVSERRRGYQHEAVGATLTLLAALSPDQRDKFVAAERAFHAAQRRRRADEVR